MRLGSGVACYTVKIQLSPFENLIGFVKRFVNRAASPLVGLYKTEGFWRKKRGVRELLRRENYFWTRTLLHWGKMSGMGFYHVCFSLSVGDGEGPRDKVLGLDQKIPDWRVRLFLGEAETT